MLVLQDHQHALELRMDLHQHDADRVDVLALDRELARSAPPHGLMVTAVLVPVEMAV